MFPQDLLFSFTKTVCHPDLLASSPNPSLTSPMKTFSLSMHIGHNSNKAATEAIFYQLAARIKNPDPIDRDVGSGVPSARAPDC